MTARCAYPSDVNDEERALIAPYLTLLPEAAAQREHSLRDVFNGLRYVAPDAMARATLRRLVRTGCRGPSSADASFHRCCAD
jgi:transposase